MGILATSDNEGKGKSRPQGQGTKKKPNPKASQNQVGDALRSVYQQTIDEEVPQDFLDILGKLA
jgi:hypothetical protein